jgi:hypothetical protein
LLHSAAPIVGKRGGRLGENFRCEEKSGARGSDCRS